MSFVKKLFLVVMGLVPILFLPIIAAQATIFAPPKDFYVWQKSQRAVLILEDKKETLVLSPQVKGDLKDFVWIIPLPSEPEITEVSDELFNSLSEITKKQITPVNGELNNDTSSVPEKTSTIETIETDNIELYEIETIQAETIEDITTYLSDNELYLPEESNYLFEEYIELDWYFVFIEVKISELPAFADSAAFEAYLPPIQLTFTTNNLFYPVKLLKIIDIQRPDEEETNEQTAIEETTREIVEGETDFSSSNFEPSQLPTTQQIDLFVLASHKKSIKGFETLYANWIDKKEISNLAADQDDATWYKPKNDKLFLTQLSGSLELSSTSSDLLLRNASDDKTTVSAHAKSSSYNWLWGVLLFFITIIVILVSPVGLFFILGATIASLSKTKRARVLGWIFEIFAFLTLCLISILLIWTSYIIISPKTVPDIVSRYASPDYGSYFILSAVVLSILAMLIILILQIKKSRRHPSAISHPLNEKSKESKSEEKTIGDKIFDDKKSEKSLETEAGNESTEKEIELEKETTEEVKPKKHYTKKIRIEPQK